MSCSVEQCDQPVRWKGVCTRHYYRAYQKGRVSIRNKQARDRRPGIAEHMRAYSKKWKSENLEKDFGYRLRTRYGITINELYALLIKQDAKCAICRDYLLGQTLHVDHCHISGEVRGILCHRCNCGLGFFRDQKDILASAVAYLEGKR